MNTTNQSRLLTALLDGELTRQELREKSHVFGATFKYTIQNLLRSEQVESRMLDSNHRISIISITQHGRSALRRINSPIGEAVPPSTISRMTGAYYTPKCFVRNDGNKHIASAGWGC